MAEAKHPPPPAPMDTLMGMTNGILIETGKFFQAASSQSSVGLASTNLKRVVPEMKKRFDEALDELEMDLLRAKAVYEQQLLDIRARNRPKPPTPIISEEKVVEEEPELETTDTPIMKEEKETKAEPETARDDVQMEDLPPPDQPTPEEPAKVDESKDAIIEDQPGGEVEPPAEKSPSPKQEEPIPNVEDTQPEYPATGDQGQERAPVSAVSQDLNFDSMFDEPNVDADLDFLNDFETDKLPDSAPGASTDLNTFLSGVETYANAAGDDFSMVFPQTTTEAPTEPNKPAQDLFDPMAMGGDMPAEQSNFDDLWGELGDGGGDGENLLNDVGEIGEFDESLFNDFQ